jgi:hypothetical protein
MKASAKLLGLCVSLALFAWPVKAQVSGWNIIRGMVVDQAGLAVDDAEVCAWGTGPMAGRLPCSGSGHNGRFSIPVSRADTYTVSAKHFAKGYPDGHFSFYGKLWGHLVKAVIQENSTPGPVKVVVGPKSGRLVLTILDGDTRLPIKTGSVTLCRVGEPKSCWGISTSFPKGRYEVLTPEVPFTIKFETWYGPIPEYHGGVSSGPSGRWVIRNAFDDKARPLETVQVDLGQRKEVTVRLK